MQLEWWVSLWGVVLTALSGYWIMVYHNWRAVSPKSPMSTRKVRKARRIIADNRCAFGPGLTHRFYFYLYGVEDVIRFCEKCGEERFE